MFSFKNSLADNLFILSRYTGFGDEIGVGVVGYLYWTACFVLKKGATKLAVSQVNEFLKQEKLTDASKFDWVAVTWKSVGRSYKKTRKSLTRSNSHMP